MARFRLRLASRHRHYNRHWRNAFVCLGLVITFIMLMISEYSYSPRRRVDLEDELDFEDVYDSDSDARLDLNPNLNLSSSSSSLKLAGNQSRILLVSALFQFPPANPTESRGSSSSSSLTHDDLSNFLQSLFTNTNADIYIFTTPDLAPSLRSIAAAARVGGEPAGRHLRVTVDASFSSPFEISPLRGREGVYTIMSERARAKAQKEDAGVEGGVEVMRRPESYALRNARPYFVERAIESLRIQENEYEYVFWADVPSISSGEARLGEYAYTAWPDPARLERVWEAGARLVAGGGGGGWVMKSDLIFVPMSGAPPEIARHWLEDLGPIEGDFSDDSFFGGPPNAMRWFSRAFYAYHDHFLRLGYLSLFAPASGGDAGVINALLLLYPERFITVWAGDPGAPARVGLGLSQAILGFGHGQGYLGACGVERYYYWWWLSAREMRDRMRVLWMQEGVGFGVNEGKESGNSWRAKVNLNLNLNLGIGTKVPCRLTRVLSVEGVLKSVFGEKWRKPVASVERPTRTW